MKYKFDTTPQRSATMKKIKSKHTIAENLLCKLLWAKGIRYRRNYKKLPGSPDIAITSKKIAVFIDGEFWHGYNWEKKKKKIKANRDYWIPKIEHTMMRDKEINIHLIENGWAVIRFWESAVKQNVETCIEKILELYNLSHI